LALPLGEERRVLRDKPVLIVEDNVYLALDLSYAVAVLAFELPDSSTIPLARALVRKRVPFVIHADTYIPSSLSVLRPGIPVLIKPIDPHDVVSILAHEVAKFELNAVQVRNAD